MCGYCLAMGFCGIAFVDVPSVDRKEGVETSHFVVACGFGKDGRGSYVGQFAVAFDDRLPGNIVAP